MIDVLFWISFSFAIYMAISGLWCTADRKYHGSKSSSVTFMVLATITAITLWVLK